MKVVDIAFMAFVVVGLASGLLVVLGIMVHRRRTRVGRVSWASLMAIGLGMQLIAGLLLALSLVL
ncbi:MAG TPA: hypothetical protein VNJ03_09460 [Vicinamibacterales bacterium]|nr:hypothetical protein [Vicinamibacterales bacterium]